MLRNSMIRRRTAFALTSLLLLASAASAEAPRAAWVNAKCALCHGMDGSSQTDTGRKKKAPDLRLSATQSKTDQVLGASIAAGHKGMPSFRKQLEQERVKALLSYIRQLVKK